MKRYFLTAAAALMLTGYTAIAQDGDAGGKKPGDGKSSKTMKGEDKLKEYDEIIIKRKNPDADGKVTIEIRDDEILVDGKPIEEYKNGELSIRKKSMNRYRMNPSPSPFRFEGGDWSMDGDDMIGEDRGFLGVITEGSSNGAKVERVTENSAAAKAGLKPGDIITRINDKEIFDHEELSNVISDLKPGDEATISYKRDGKETKTTAKLGKRKVHAIRPNVPDMPPMVFNFDDNENFNGNQNFEELFEIRNRPRLGIKAQDTEEGNGVKILEVEEGSAAAKAGIKKDDIITSFDGKDVKSASELARASKEAREKTSLKVQLKRDGKTQNIEVKIPKKLKTTNL